MNWETHKILITVKTYPTPSKKYVETVCVAGISLTAKRFLRLYPIPFRDLDESQKFKKYTIIEAKITKAAADKRPESYKIDTDSIKIISWLDTKKDNWAERKKLVLPITDKSMCGILQEQPQSDQSLGLIKPERIEFRYTPAQSKDITDREACYAQLGFFNRSKNVIEPIPFEFRYKFFCAGKSDCLGHDYLIIDWEIGQAYRDWRKRYSDPVVLLAKIKQMWLDKICSSQRDVHFYVGNMQRFRNNFMVLGAFYPPK